MFLSIASRFAVLDPVEDLALTLASPIQQRLSAAVRPLADVVTDYSDRQRLADENARLRADLERLSVEVARLRENEARVATLEGLLGVRSAFPEETFIAASVAGRSPDALKSVLILNRGASDGVREGMVVLSEGKSLVGQVSRVTANHAWVTLVTDPSSAVSAYVQESRATGVVVGTHGDDAMEMQYVRQGLAVHEGDTVITSGEGGKTPPGLVIGRVTKASATDQDLFQQVTVQPLAALSRLDTVLIMTSFLPQSPGSLEPSE
jgi:rod shape-determining protein MreC